ncbi:SET domain-containing protein [Sansalvadorimonas verongulae]|uniref:SET domain-containing protein n=1 Tax=Sansalvadorimonas verongulae TaxID=2172824 RepID=UPI0012BC3C01|nr:SET domain-containing protein [Sansalvadorimonas verongulae]MTI14796.1 SET domain-containing protein-lysine N-methyltransferase [Sansalvadorimonas verongulae]
MLYISSIIGKGRGVLTSKKIERDTVIERCPIIILPPDDVANLRKTELNNYYFCWGSKQESAAIALGMGSIYNHSYTPNALYRPCQDEQVLEIVAIKKILPNDEITINYNGSPNDQSPLWQGEGEENQIEWQK